MFENLLVSDVLFNIIIFLSLFVTTLIVEPNDVKNDQVKKKRTKSFQDLHDETLVYFFRLVAVFERIVVFNSIFSQPFSV